MHWDLGRSIVLTWIWRIDIKVTLQCTRYDHCITIVTSTMPGLILPVLSWALTRRISHPDPFCSKRCSQSIKVQWSMPRFTSLPPPTSRLWLYISGTSHQLFFITKNEVKDDIKWMNENMKWHEEGGLKSVECWNWGNKRTPRKPIKIPKLLTRIVPLMTHILKLWTPTGLGG